jgi:hypothetical protein
MRHGITDVGLPDLPAVYFFRAYATTALIARCVRHDSVDSSLYFRISLSEYLVMSVMTA